MNRITKAVILLLLGIAGMAATASSVSAQTIVVGNSADEMPRYASDPYVCVAAAKGKFYFNTVSNAPLYCNGSSWVTWAGGTIALDDLTDVTLTSPASGEVLAFNGSVWVNSAVGTATNAQTGTTYTIATADCLNQKLITFTNASAITVTMLAANNASCTQKTLALQNIGSTTVTVNRAGSDTFTGNNLGSTTALLMVGGQRCKLTSDGTSSWAVDCGGGNHVIAFGIDGGGSAITTGDLGVFPTAQFACTIYRTDVSADQSGSITVDIWKRAGAIPTSAQKISASAPVTLSAAQLNQNGSISGWTTGVSPGDIFGATVATSATVTKVTVQIWCK